MKKLLFAFAVSLICIPSLASARSVKMISSSEDPLSLSVEYEYTTGSYEGVTGSTDQDTGLDQRLGLVRLSLKPGYRVQFYGTAGTSSNTFGDTDTEDGTVIGGGVQFLLEKNDNLGAKLVGSYLQHESLQLEGTNRELEVVGDWQAGLVMNRTVNDSYSEGNPRLYDAFFGVLYSGREIEETGGGTVRTYEPSNNPGLSAAAGFNVNYTPALDLEISAELGAMSSASLHATYAF